MRKRTAAPTLVGLALLALACDSSSPVADIPVRVEVAPVLDTVLVGERSTRLTARAFNANDDEIPDAKIRWTGTETSVAVVDSLTGAVTGVRAGMAEVTARAGLVADSAEIQVLNVLLLALPLDTILLAPGDTFTIPVVVRTFDGAVPPATVFRGGAAGVATIDSMTGLVTALGPGSAPFSATVDTVRATGQLSILEVVDTLFGAMAAVFEGAVQAHLTLSSRAFNHPDDIGGTVFQVSASTADEQLALVFQDSLTGPTTRTVGTLTPAAIGPGTDPICRPSVSFVYFRQTPTAITALSISGGTMYARPTGAVPGGQGISGRFDVTLQRTDVDGETGQTRVRGTFVVPLVTYASCPK
jgi:Bacterial Ig-like domain (group 2)